MSKKARLRLKKEEDLKLDIGCGPNKREGFKGIDILDLPGVDYVMDITKTPWPFSDDSVDEAQANHIIEHLTPIQRCGFVNELHRVLKKGGKCLITAPHWASCRAFGDPTHVWPPVSEFWFYYLNKEWRLSQAIHTDAKHMKGGFNCDFDSSWGYNMRGDLNIRNQEYQQFAMANYKEVCQDIVATIVKK